MSFPFDLFRLEGRVALITGGGGGLGIQFARALAGAGAEIALLGRNLDTAQQAADSVAQEFGQRCIAVSADVTDPAQMKAAVAQVTSALGSLDILINNAGVNVRKPSLEFSLDDWHRVIDTSLTGAFVASQAAAPAMIERGWGRMINISSMFGLVGIAERPAYTAAKGGMIQLTRTLAWEWAKHGITVNALAPGPFETEMNRPLVDNPVTYGSFAERIALNRWGKLEEVAGPILFLASEASSFATGSVLTLDGGWTAQ